MRVLAIRSAQRIPCVESRFQRLWQVGERGDGRARPGRVCVVVLGRSDYPHAECGRAGEFAVCAVADVDAIGWSRAQAFGGGEVDPRIRLGYPKIAGEDGNVESPGERAFRPSFSGLGGGVADQTETPARVA